VSLNSYGEALVKGSTPDARDWAGIVSVGEGGEPGREQLVRDARSDSYTRVDEGFGATSSPQDRISS